MAELETETRSEQIGHILRDEILGGRYLAGDRLPSERDLAARFHGSRGAVREAFRMLEQLGLAEIKPGGARVMPIENANIDVIGALLTLHEVPDVDLVGQVFDAFSGLSKIAVQQMIERAADEELEEARRLIRQLSGAGLTAEEQMDVRMAMGKFFMDKSHNLMLRLINNSIRTQFVEKEEGGTLPKADPEAFAEPVARLDAAIGSRDGEAAARALGEIAAIDRQLILDAIEEHTRNLVPDSARAQS
jgi:DNA-binding FadR family transcriptional regulator